MLSDLALRAMGGLLEGPRGGLSCTRRDLDRVAVVVDAGYLFAQGSAAVCGRKLARGRIPLDYDAVTAKL